MFVVIVCIMFASKVKKKSNKEVSMVRYNYDLVFFCF